MRSESLPKFLPRIVTPVPIEVPFAVEVRLLESSQRRRDGKAPKDDENPFEATSQGLFLHLLQAPIIYSSLVPGEVGGFGGRLIAAR